MKIKQLTIECYRNISSMIFCPDEGANVIYGDNAQGKTNLLEAVWLFSGSKSFRGSKESEYLQFQQPHAMLDLQFYAQAREQEASIHWSKDGRVVRLNEIKQERIGNFSGVFCSVVFSPDHLSLIKQGPDRRRKMIDLFLCQAYPKYSKVLEGYAKTLKQRNILLRDIPRSSALLDTLDVWDHNLVEYGSYITAMRAGYIRKLASHASRFYEGISSGKEQLAMVYRSGIGNEIEQMDRDSIRQAMQRELRLHRGEDIRSGMSEIGPHRDDLDLFIDGKSAKAFGSQGQQRSCILAIKLAECGILEERNQEPPVIMLDDVMSELDEHRRNFLLNQIHGRQVLITCCDKKDFEKMGIGKIFQIENGALIKEFSPQTGL